MKRALKATLVTGLVTILAACGGTRSRAGGADAPRAASAASGPRQVVELTEVRATGRFLPPHPQAITSFGSARVGESVVLLGGYFGTPHAYSKEGQSRAVWALDTSATEQRWREVAQLEQGLQGLAAVEHAGEVCHFGGNHAANADGEKMEMTSVRTARCLRLETGQWRDLPPLPVGRSSHGVAKIGSTVYLAGGWALSGEPSSGRFAKDVVALDLENAEAGWRSIAAPFRRRALGVAAAGGRLVIVGGMSEDGELSKQVDVLDVESGTWSTGPEHPGDAFGIAAAGDGESVYASGREGILRRFSPTSGSWEEVGHLALSRFFHELVPVGDSVVAVGGIGGMHTRGRTRVVEQISKTGGLAYGELTFPTPAKSKNRQGYLVRGEEVYFFGGNVSLGQHDFAPEHFTAEGWRLDLATLKLTSAAPFPFPRQSMQVLPTKEGALAVGGFGHHPTTASEKESMAVARSGVFQYSWDEDTWRKIGTLPRGRTQFGLASFGEELWALGGLNYDPDRKEPFEHETSILSAAAKSEEVSFTEAGTSLPAVRRAFAGAAHDGRYYLVGGMKERFELVEDCLVFEHGARRFSEIPCPEPRLSGDLVPLGGKLYLVGGKRKGTDGLEESREIAVYDPKRKEWSNLDFELPLSTSHLRALPFEDRHLLLVTTQHEEARMTVAVLTPPR